MAKKDTRSFWIVVGAFACIHPIVFLTLQNLMLEAYQGMSVGRGLLLIFTLPVVAVMTPALVMPVTLLTGVLSAVWSRKTQSSARWIIRSALLSAVLASCSYIPLYMISRMGMEAWLVWLLTMPNAAVAGAMAAWASQRWRPRTVPMAVETTEEGHAQAPLEATAQDVELEQKQEQEPADWAAFEKRKKSSLLGVVLVFTTGGSLIAGIIFLLSLVALFVAVGESLLVALATAAGVLLVLGPLGAISALITGLISGLVSRGTLSTWRWLGYTAALGGGLTAFSLQTVLVMLISTRDHGMWSNIVYSLGMMFVLGAVSAFVCGWLCRGFRPRNFQLQSF